MSTDIQVEKLNFFYGKRRILHDVCFTARPGEVCSVLGPNGVGKSTLFRCILGLLEGYGGSIRVDGQEVSAMTPKALARHIAYIPQAHYPSFNYTVLDTVVMGTSHHLPITAAPGPAQYKKAEEALAQMGISALAARSYTRLSGGEQQLTLMARALAQDTPVLLMDEPTASLDFGNQVRVLTKVRELARAGYTILQSTHNPEQTFQFSDSILALKDGAVLAHGAPRDIITDALMQAVYGVDLRVESLFEDRVRVCVPRIVSEG